jgi:hypothetical protein
MNTKDRILVALVRPVAKLLMLAKRVAALPIMNHTGMETLVVRCAGRLHKWVLRKAAERRGLTPDQYLVWKQRHHEYPH